MIGVDTNVLIRFLTADVAQQHKLTRDFFKSRSASDPAFISALTLAETLWVLRRSYRLSAAEIAGCVEELLDSTDIHLDARDVLSEALANGNFPAHLADFLIVHLGARAGCHHTVTLDRRSAKAVPGMELLS